MSTINLKETKVTEKTGNFLGYLEQSYQPGDLFAHASTDWREKFDSEGLKTLVSAVVDEPTKERLSSLKIIRKTGMRLVDLYKLISSEHKTSAEFTELIWGIGDLRDAARFPDRRKKLAEQLMTKIDVFERTGLPVFKPVPFQSFLETYRQIITDIRAYLTADKLTLHHYHKLRYRVRTLRHYFAILAVVKEDPIAQSFSKLLEPVSVEMGKVQDQIVGQKLTGRVDIHQATRVVDPEHLAIIAQFLSYQTDL